MPSDNTLWILACTVLATVSLAVALLAWASARRWRILAARYETGLVELRQDVRGLCAGAVGVDERIARIEQTGRRLKERQEQLELRDSGERLYSQAIRMVHKGSSPDELVSVCGLSPNEAELIMMMHSVDKAG